MTIKHIKCSMCQRAAGEIRDAKLLQDLHYICNPCYEALILNLDLIVDRLDKSSEKYNKRPC